jgi:hypothetical protein
MYYMYYPYHPAVILPSSRPHTNRCDGLLTDGLAHLTTIFAAVGAVSANGKKGERTRWLVRLMTQKHKGRGNTLLRADRYGIWLSKQGKRVCLGAIVAIVG